jgi:serine/threonine protein kinase
MIIPGGWTAPEQQYGGISTFQSDIYSAGAVSYFLLTGRSTAHCVTSKEQKSPFDVNPNVKVFKRDYRGHDARESDEVSIVSKNHSAKFKKIKSLTATQWGCRIDRK